MKTCSKCKESLQDDAFYKGQRYCKECSKLYKRGRHDPNSRNRRLKRTYGISQEDYTKMFEDQGGVCAICSDSCSTFDNLCVDHDHTTGQVRGLLCKSCNIALGEFKDNISLLQAAIDYVSKQRSFS